MLGQCISSFFPASPEPLPAAMVDRVQALFPDLPLETQLTPALPGSDAGGLDALARGLRTLADTG